MKKKLFLAGGVVVMATAAGTGYTVWNAALSSLLDANVEALTQDETSELGRLMYRDYRDGTTEFCCDRAYKDKPCGAADC